MNNVGQVFVGKNSVSETRAGASVKHADSAGFGGFRGLMRSLAGQIDQSTDPADTRSLLRHGLPVIDSFSRAWQSIDAMTGEAVKSLPDDMRSLFLLQLAVSQAGVETQLLSAFGEAFSSTVKRVQQMGAG